MKQFMRRFFKAFVNLMLAVLFLFIFCQALVINPIAAIFFAITGLSVVSAIVDG
jgi:hypothetical protein